MQRAENQPETISLMIYAGLYCKLWRVADAGTIIPQHSHRYDHVTAIMQGGVRVFAGEAGPPVDHYAPDFIKIPAHTKHLFVALTDNVMLACLHAADRLEGDEPAVAEEHHIALEG